ncbi:hypothetical protein RB195_007734 [Necator americanus]|uniref:Apyrase n=1 Tax=Necator americanus TaxID=51031 RepID=A0ABR1C1D2_NECAM
MKVLLALVTLVLVGYTLSLEDRSFKLVAIADVKLKREDVCSAVFKEGTLTLSLDKKNVTVKWESDPETIALGQIEKAEGKFSTILTQDNCYIAPYDKSISLPKVNNENWKDFFASARRGAGYGSGYMTFEAVQWSSAKEMWYFLPRKASESAFDKEKDKKKGARVLIYSPDLKSFDAASIRNRENRERSFTAFNFIPNTNDELIAAIKVKENRSSTESFLTVFDVTDRNTVMDDQKFDDNHKFEAIYFV